MQINNTAAANAALGSAAAATWQGCCRHTQICIIQLTGIADHVHRDVSWGDVSMRVVCVWLLLLLLLLPAVVLMQLEVVVAAWLAAVRA
jgi:hypothetical protein